MPEKLDLVDLDDAHIELEPIAVCDVHDKKNDDKIKKVVPKEQRPRMRIMDLSFDPSLSPETGMPSPFPTCNLGRRYIRREPGKRVKELAHSQSADEKVFGNQIALSIYSAQSATRNTR